VPLVFGALLFVIYVQLNAGDHHRVVALNPGGTAYGADATV
jgi:hypothetical protein